MRQNVISEILKEIFEKWISDLYGQIMSKRC